MSTHRHTTDEWNRIEKVFHAVVELDPIDQRKRLSELTQHDAQLRAEVESLLAHDAGDAKLPAVVAQNEPQALQPSRAIGSQTGRYLLLFPLAVNRSSEVWCAKDLESEFKDARVALKFLRRESHEERRVERFRNEADLLSRFRHPNIAEFLHYGQDADGTPFIVTRFVPGVPITEFADQRNLGLQQRLSLLSRVCEAVSYAHRFLVIHRDLKPQNILVTSDGEPVILDFGISKLLPSSLDETDVSLTTTHERPMTPAYASPEQVHGEPITTATDLYALGLILYELVAGHHAYSDAAQPDEEKLFDRICGTLPIAPSDIVGEEATPFATETPSVPKSPRMIAALRDASPRQLKRQLRGGVDNVVLRALAKAPTDRYASLADFRNDLNNLIANRPVSARGKQFSFREQVQRRPTAFLMATCLLTALAVGAWNRYTVQKLREDANNTVQQITKKAADDRATLDSRYLEMLQRALSDDSKQKQDWLKSTLGEMESIDLRATIAKRLVTAGELDSATELIGEIEAKLGSDIPADVDRNNHPNVIDSGVELTPDARIALSGAYQLLGRPSKALATLACLLTGPVGNGDSAEQHDPVLDRRSRELHQLVTRLLLDAGRHQEAKNWADSHDIDGDNVQRDTSNASRASAGREQLLIAELRNRYGWTEGAEQVLTDLKRDAAKLGLSAEQHLQMSWLQASLSNDPTQILQFATQRIGRQSPDDDTNIESDSSIEKRTASESADWLTKRPLLIAIQNEARFQLASLAAEAGDTEKAKALYNEVMTELTSAKLDGHFLITKSLYQLALLAEDANDRANASKYHRAAWERICAGDEMATQTAAWTAIYTMRYASTSERKATLKRLGKYRQTHEFDPYIRRQFLDFDAEMAIEERRWAEAQATLQDLEKLESKLWGSGSLEHSYALSQRGYVEQNLGQSAAANQTLGLVRRNIKQLAENLAPAPANGFLAPVIQVGDGAKPLFEWIQFFKMHRFNAIKDQRGMVEYVSNEIEDAYPKDAAILRATIQ